MKLAILFVSGVWNGRLPEYQLSQTPPLPSPVGFHLYPCNPRVRDRLVPRQKTQWGDLTQFLSISIPTHLAPDVSCCRVLYLQYNR